jgi:hypothetical protein
MVDFNFFDCFYADLANGVHNLGSDALKVALSDTAPSASDADMTDITQIANGNGYTTGGSALTSVTSTQTNGVYSLEADDTVFTASGGAMAQFRYAVLYNDDASSDELIGWWDAGTEINLADTETCTITLLSGRIFRYRLES